MLSTDVRLFDFYISHGWYGGCDIELSHMGERSDVQEIALPPRQADFHIVSEANPTAVRRKKINQRNATRISLRHK